MGDLEGTIWRNEIHDAFICQVDKGVYKFVGFSGNRVYDESFGYYDVQKFKAFCKEHGYKKTPLTLKMKLTPAMKILYGQSKRVI